MKQKQEIALCAAEVKETLEAYHKLEEKAEEILHAGSCGADDISGISLGNDGKSVELSYWTSCRGEHYIDAIEVPIEWFGIRSRDDIAKQWELRREAARRAAERAARRAEKRRQMLKKTEAERKQKKEIAELKRLKAKYPGV